MVLTFKKIKEDKDISELSDLAAKIWNTHYPPIIGQKQVDYMLNKFYSREGLKEQILDKQNIFSGAYANGKMAGFISYRKTGDEDFFIHKLYVNTEIHSKGIGRALFDNAFKNKNIKTIRLTVNRQNIAAVNFYFRLGFTIEKITDIDIGEGYVMNDFIMLFRK